MCANYYLDADFASHLIRSLKEMRKSNGLPFITNGITLPFLAYAYKRLNCDESPITEEYIHKIISSIENAKDDKFIYQHCSEIDEDVIALETRMEDRLEEQGYYARFSNSTMLYDPDAFEKAPSSKQLYDRYSKVISNNSFSRVRKEYKYDWDVVSDEDDNAINEIINDYRKSNNKFKEYEKNINLTYIATTIIC